MCRSLRPLVFAALVAMYCVNASGQPRYAPSRPAISPWLNLTGGGSNFGGLPDYYRLVRPQQEQRRFETLAIQRFSLIDELRTSGSTGSGSVFNNLSHYYPSSRTRSGRRR